MLFFRIHRELSIQAQGEPIWIACSDWLLLAATTIALVFVLLPLISGLVPEPPRALLAAAACSTSIVLVSGYLLAILAHYRLIFGRGRDGPRENPEPAEQIAVVATAVLAFGVFLAVFVVSAG